MNENEDEACDNVDACVFTGDMLYRPAARARFIAYLESWQRAVEASADEVVEEPPRATPGERIAALIELRAEADREASRFSGMAADPFGPQSDKRGRS